ncbi:MAG: hypothetical protein KC423_26000 [Anaerolineales bacterium]|nr:hypothetical protein [Anaerolineales bacterium]MCA9996921.1 hypothetical protein [Anaerolineales bacterium]
MQAVNLHHDNNACLVAIHSVGRSSQEDSKMSKGQEKGKKGKDNKPKLSTKEKRKKKQQKKDE